MATTDATRSRPTATRISRGGPVPVRLGVERGYPFSLVRKLVLVFLGVLTFCVAGAWLLAQNANPGVILIHWVPVAVAILASLYVVELVGVTERPLPPITAESLFWAIATSCIVMAVGYAIAPTYPPSTTLVCLAPVVSAVCIYLQRKWIEARGIEAESLRAILFAGDRAAAIRAMAELAQLPYIRVSSIIMPDGIEDRAPLAGVEIDTPDRIPTWIKNYDARLIIVSDADNANLNPVLSPCIGAGCMVERVDDLVARSQGRLNLAVVDEIDLLGRLSAQANRFSFQRVFDLVFGLLIAIPSAILAVFIAITVKLTSKGPIFFKQTRVGRWGREFTVYKFRTMRVNAERESGPVFASRDDPRITRIGRFLRKTRMDEIPQLVNVFLGDMSLIGPRPERPYFVANLGRNIAFYHARHAVRPGLTGWAQVRYQYGSDDDDARNKLAYELYYILHRSAVFYFAVLLETVKVVLFRRGSR